MSLANLLSVEQIIPEMKATERWAAIVELIDLLRRFDPVDQAAQQDAAAADDVVEGEEPGVQRSRGA